MNVEIGAKVALFPENEYIKGIFVAVWRPSRRGDQAIISYYNQVLQAIQKAEELGRMQDLLTPNQLEVLLTFLPRKEANYT
jgi:hypothetical protein